MIPREAIETAVREAEPRLREMAFKSDFDLWVYLAELGAETQENLSDRKPVPLNLDWIKAMVKVSQDRMDELNADGAYWEEYSYERMITRGMLLAYQSVLTWFGIEKKG